MKKSIIIIALIALMMHDHSIECMKALKRKQEDIAAEQLSTAQREKRKKRKSAKPKVDLKKGSEGNEYYGAAWDQGLRSTMEDAHDTNVAKEYAFFGLYDGHGGRDVADFAANNLQKHCGVGIDCKSGTWLQKMDESIKKAFKAVDDELDEQEFDSQRQGCTTVIAIAKCGYLFVAHAGDARAVRFTVGEDPFYTNTMDHKPNKDERERIEKAGGKIKGGRVWNKDGTYGLAVARSLGDKSLRPYVISEPDLMLAKGLGAEDVLLILACDGVWDVIGSEDAVKIVLGIENLKIDFENFALGKSKEIDEKINAFKNGQIDLEEAAERLRDRALQKGSSDNVSVIVVNLQRMRELYPAPKV